MKRRNRLLSALLSCLLLFSLFSTTALATEDEESPDDSQSETPVVVSSLEELQAAIAAAKDGDTIALSGGINIIENCIVGDTEKQITVVVLILVQSLSLHLTSPKNPNNRNFPKKHRQCPRAPLILDTIILRRI